MSRVIRRRLGRYLSFKREYLKDVLNGKKRSTIRLGVVKITSNRVFLESGGKVHGELSIDSVRYVKLSRLSEADARRDGFNSLSELKKALRDIYPQISDDDVVTVINFRLVKRFDKPVPKRREYFEREEGVDWQTVAKLALAYDVANTILEKRVLAAVSLTGSIEDAVKSLNGVIDEAYTKSLLEKALRKLRAKGIKL